MQPSPKCQWLNRIRFVSLSLTLKSHVDVHLQPPCLQGWLGGAWSSHHVTFLLFILGVLSIWPADQERAWGILCGRFCEQIKDSVHHSTHIPFVQAQSHGLVVRLAMLYVGAEKEQGLIYKNIWRSHNILVMMAYSLLKITQFCAVLNFLCW